ncbi:hypothetical protein RUMLAC_00483 [[Ruminococcus] lactaris ATCC 29176]|uniref:Uncharacterized protein n=1 Tax=[Ruminococcus] lactaris ATCC 29176 TaxID=471875 RepID=B5CM09_9FIRM|nr:hypothetical protein RUMLAC_00483 [[Ruminococcus] lactaris ATCC 29176]
MLTSRANRFSVHPGSFSYQAIQDELPAAGSLYTRSSLFSY